ncbi:hypothetical protein COURTHOUSE_98 [Mycobacterium phage Courthouse]|uniref:Uncharacterized protein n=2 Tax=Omegavirus courthouse TaxID=1089119 RepID=G8I5F5_9CAUD|nr:hypothetical protein CM09_gp098 [Mycobacterium phage Courthouse]YP_009205233.1 hypothetical protein AVT17_gp103 [Mycobacterium phage Ariel]YP_009213320.1 hypothetical protein AVV70_gp103 [Mycobacterium phage MiaZeal]ASD50730.1 hypothetical protein PORCELAIN_101 [Mycobacterium phage Porcelain]ASZ74177.1 hypothetical protein SEA_SQUINT_101 [Mycobacterium phage Squint]ATS92942.1 hypothetical protein SEA_SUPERPHIKIMAN_100 [Mycobacterium phage Superphikiman]AER47949.1 hypothetical protein COURT
MIFVEIECDNPNCPNGSEYVDVYLDAWHRGAPVNTYLPEGWRVANAVECPDCAGIEE